MFEEMIRYIIMGLLIGGVLAFAGWWVKRKNEREKKEVTGSNQFQMRQGKIWLILSSAFMLFGLIIIAMVLIGGASETSDVGLVLGGIFLLLGLLMLLSFIAKKVVVDGDKIICTTELFIKKEFLVSDIGSALRASKELKIKDKNDKKIITITAFMSNYEQFTQYLQKHNVNIAILD